MGLACGQVGIDIGGAQKEQILETGAKLAAPSEVIEQYY